MIRTLVNEHGFELVLEEGNSGVVPVTEVFWTGDHALRVALAESFLKEGKITGAEFSRASGGRPFDLIGAEDAARYRRHLDLKRAVLADRTDASNRLISIRKELRRQSRKAFAPELSRYLKASEEFWAGRGLPPFPVPASPDFQSLVDEDARRKNSLVRSPAERLLIVRLETISVLLRLCRLESSREDLAFLRANDAVWREIVGGDSILKGFLRSVFEFYQLAEARDRALAENALKALRRSRSGRAILVTGGFHTEGISRILRQAGVGQEVLSSVPGPERAALREPNLLNLHVSEARLFADLRGLKMSRGVHRRMFREDARRLMGPDLPGWVFSGAALDSRMPLRKDAVVLLPLSAAPSEAAVESLSRWSEALLKTNAVDLVLAVRSQRDQRRLRSMLRTLPPEIRPRLQVIRVLTGQDFGALKRLLQGRFVLLFAEKSDRRRFRNRGIEPDYFLAADWNGRQAESPLLTELARLQSVYRSIVTSA
ncbi:MAG: hypothetical protein HY714_01615 [Candidatus Omnitrophica bacterium]|nr:hypothetical protein [Candidatus Omnitrophota bacterium]